MDDSTSRRKLLQAIGSAGVMGSLAGCNDSVQATSASPQYIHLEGGQYADLEQYDSMNTTVNKDVVSYSANVLLYADTAVEHRVNELTMGSFDKSPQRVIGTVFIQSSGIASSITGAIMGQVQSQVATQFKNQLQSFGIENMQVETDTSSEYKVTGTVSIPSFEMNIMEGISVSLAPQPLQIEAGFELKMSENNNIVGVLWINPQNYAHEFEKKSLTSDTSEGINVTPEVILNFKEYYSVSKSEVSKTVQNTQPKPLIK